MSAPRLRPFTATKVLIIIDSYSSTVDSIQTGEMDHEIPALTIYQISKFVNQKIGLTGRPWKRHLTPNTKCFRPLMTDRQTSGWLKWCLTNLGNGLQRPNRMTATTEKSNKHLKAGTIGNIYQSSCPTPRALDTRSTATSSR